MCLILGQVIDNYKITWIPHSVAAIVLGAIIGVIIYLTSEKETKFFMFNDSLFFFALLPPIVFDAGYAMKRTNFFRNMWSILLFAVLGTIISTFVIGYGIWGLAKAGAIDVASNSPVDSLIFGALISSIDPIATLAILGNKALNVPPLLYSLVFGESVLNDAIAITLFDTFKEFHKREFSSASAGKAIGIFLGIALGSLFVGAVFALMSAAILRKLNFIKNPASEFTIILFFAYGSYCMAEVAHLSGIISLFSCGVMQAHYAWYNISNVSRTTTRHAFHAFAHIAESFLYTYLGITAVLSCTETTGYKWSGRLIFFALLMCFVSRALNIFPLAFIANLRRKQKIPFRMQVLMWFSGLRGAISFALAIRMDSPDPDASKYVTTTMIIIILTTVIMGGLSNWFLGCLGLTNPNPPQREILGADGTTGLTVDQQFVPLHEAHEHTASPTVTVAPSLSREPVAHDERDPDDHGPTTRARAESTIGLTREEMALSGKERAKAIIQRRLAESRTRPDGTPGEKLGKLHEWWIRFDIMYMQPWFGGRHAPKMEGAEEEGEDNSQMPNPYLAKVVPQMEVQLGAEEQQVEDEIKDELDRKSVAMQNMGPSHTQSLLGDAPDPVQPLANISIVGDTSPSSLSSATSTTSLVSNGNCDE